MARSISKYPWSGILCLEGEWNHQQLKDESSVLPGLELLRRLEIIQYVHRDVATSTELRHYLDRWRRERLKFRLLYLALHGSPDGVCIRHGDDDVLPIDELGAWLSGRLDNCIIHFGACSVLLAEKAKLRRFKEQTGALAITGYKEEIDWVDSMAWDLIFMKILASYKTFGTVEKHLAAPKYRSLRKELGFNIIS